MRITLTLIITSLCGLTVAHPAFHKRSGHRHGTRNTGIVGVIGSSSTNTTSGNDTIHHHCHHHHNTTTNTSTSTKTALITPNHLAVTLDTRSLSVTPPRTLITAEEAAVLWGRDTAADTTAAAPAAVDIAAVEAAATGRMTYYTPGQGSCGATNTATDLVVAVPAAAFGTYANPNASPACQMTATITCGSKTVRAAVRDKCPGCGAADIDVSPAVFKLCGDLSLGVMQVSWAIAK